MDTIANLINRLRDHNIDISLSGADLEISFDGHELPHTILEEIRYYKPGIVDFLKNAGMGREMDIPVAPLQSDYPLSSSQKRMWVLHQLDTESTFYSLPEMHVMEGPLDPVALDEAFRIMVNRHEILRTVFCENEAGAIRQVVLSGEGKGLVYEDLRNEKEQEQLLMHKTHAILRTPFDLSRGPLIRVALFRTEQYKWVLAYVMHHIISDGWSMGILVKELLLLYNARIRGIKSPLQPLSIQYKDYAVWQVEQLSGYRMNAHRQYWLQKFAAGLQVLDLPADRPRPAIKTYHGAVVVTQIRSQLALAAKALWRQQGCTVFMGMLAVLKGIFYRYTGQEDIIVGTPVAGRDHTALENQIGFYINTLALRTCLKGSDSMETLLNKVKRVTLEAYEHQEYPFDELVSELDLKRDISRHPLFDVMVVMQNVRYVSSAEQATLQDIKVSRFGRENERVSKFDLTMDFIETDGGIRIEMEYNTDLYEPATIECLGKHMANLLEAAVQSPSTPIQELDYLDLAEKQQLDSFNSTDKPYPHHKTLVQLFEEQVKSRPEAVALTFEGKDTSFAALNAMANRLARFLREQYAIQPDDLIAVKLARGSAMITALLGILKSGAAYIPIDPDYPQERIDYILQDSGCKVLIDEQLLAVIPETEEDDLPLEITAHHLAYVIYTSGSTGRPKGCLLEHTSIVNRISWMWEHYQFSTRDVILQKTTYTFDVSVWEIFMPLCFGARMVICPKEIAASPSGLLTLIREQQVSCLHFVPGILQDFMHHLFAENDIAGSLGSLRCVFASGEALAAGTVMQWYDRMQAPLYNLYGPTEAAVDVTHYTTSLHDKRIPIGKPIWNTRMFVLDPLGNPVPVGIPGQICIGGAGLARGYLHQEELTNSKFVPASLPGVQRIYKTGDLGRWLRDGNIEFLGRMDDQVKIRGLRIELGEIESLLMEMEILDNAIVAVRKHPNGDHFLVAYLISKKIPDPAEIRNQLAKRLPAYMIPQYYVQLDKLPLGASGKVDRKQLPDPDAFKEDSSSGYIAPGTSTEIVLAGLWTQLLGRPTIGLQDDFFNLGGHSLKAIRLAGLIYKTFQVKLSLKDLLDHTTLEAQACFIAAARKEVYKEITPVPEAPDYPLSSAQQRLWFSCQFDTSNIAYNIPAVYLFEGHLDQEALRLSCTKLLQRHESLRTAFRKNEQGQVRQYILAEDEPDFNIRYTDLRQHAEPDHPAAALIRDECLHPFDLTIAPLLRTSVIQLTDQKWVLIFVIHHIVSDGWSMQILFSELLETYKAIRAGIASSPVPLKIQYRDYAAWQQMQLEDETNLRHRTYWLKQLEGELPILELPGDQLRPPVKTYNAGAVSAMIDTVLTARLKAHTTAQGATLFMGLLTAVNALLYRYTHQEDIIIGSPIAGREHTDLTGQIGLYLNTLALRTRFSGTDNFPELLARTKQVAIEAYEHQIYPFDVLVGELAIPRDPSRNALFDVVIEWQQADMLQAKGPDDLKIFEYRTGKIELCKFDLYFKFIERGDEIELLLHYNSDIYFPETITRMARHLQALLSAMLMDPEKPVKDLDYLNAEEIQQLLVQFNATAKDYPEDKSVVALFEEQVLRTPDHTALVFEDTRLDYRTLDERINRVANYLLKHYPLGADKLIAILLDPSAEMIIATFAVLKTGSAYVPVDPELPASRIEFLLKDTGAAVLLTTTAFLPALENYTGAIICMDQAAAVAQSPASAPAIPINMQDLAYVIYTSGSTGLPKGVMIRHASLVDYFYGITDHTNLKECRTFAMASTLAADLGNTVIYTSLLLGGTLLLFPRSVLMEPEKMFATPIDFLKIVPSHWKSLQTTGKTYLPEKCMIMGGEPLTPDIVAMIRKSGSACRLFNHYGPTEVTIGKVINDVDISSDKTVTLGRPFCSIAVYVVDEQQKLTPPGVIGEICIAGKGLARGYINRPDMTAQRFVPNPFTENDRMYRTGDLGRWNAAGTLEFFGRKDDQVKIRGYRIELGEIEKALRDHPDIDASFVKVSTAENNEKELIAYIVSRQPLSFSRLRDHLSAILPAYMLPTYFVFLDKLPLTPNGKVDRKKLPDPGLPDMPDGAVYVAPRNDIEHRLVRIWEALLNRTNIGVQDDYFMLGGNSLKVISIIKRMQDETGVTVPVKVFFKEKTVEGVAAYIATASLPASPEQVLKKEAPLSWTSYNQLSFLTGWKLASPLVITPYEFDSLDLDAFRLAVQQLVSRHDILRARFVKTADGQIMQEVQPVAAFQVNISAPVFISDQEQLDELIEMTHERQLDPFSSPLILIDVYSLYNGKYLVLLTMHHALTDGHSDSIIRSELMACYIAALQQSSPDLPPLAFQYSDFVNWQRDFLLSREGLQHKEYWRDRLKGFMHGANIFGNHKSLNDTKGKSFCISGLIEGTTLKALDKVAVTAGITRAAFLMGAWVLLLKQLGCPDEVSLLVTVSGRNSPHYGALDLSGLIGYFANALIVSNRLDDTQSFTEHCQQVQQGFLDDLLHSAYPIEKLLEDNPEVSPVAFMNEIPFFNYHNYDHLSNHHYNLTEVERNGIVSRKQWLQMPLGLAVKEYQNCLKPEFFFDHRRFDLSAVNDIYTRYLNILHLACTNPNIKIPFL